MAMKLHTKDQAPKEGEQKAAEQPFQKASAVHDVQLQTRLSIAAPRCCGAATAAEMYIATPKWNTSLPWHSGSRAGRAT